MINPEFNISIFVNACNKRLWSILKKTGNFWEGFAQGIGIVLPRTVCGNQDERCDSSIYQSDAFQIISTNFSVLSEHYPTASPAFGQPLRVQRIVPKVIRVDLNFQASLAKGFRNGIFAEATVNEENNIFKLLFYRELRI